MCQLAIPPYSRIWVTPYEYAGNLVALQGVARRRRASIEVMPVQPDGALDLQWVRENLDERVALVSVVHIPSGVGTVLPIEEIGALLAGSAAVCVVDACQSVGQVDVDVSAIRCHILTASGRKFLRGPRGSGFAFLRRDLQKRLEPATWDLHVAEVESLTSLRLTARSAVRFETAERSGALLAQLQRHGHCDVVLLEEQAVHQPT